MKSEHTPPTKYHITFLRHGQSVGNAEGYHQGQAEFPLTEKGRAQVRALVKRWQAEKLTFDQAIASPQSRARETAEIITAVLNIPLEFDEIWMERDNGILAGLQHEEALEKYPQPEFIPTYQHIGQMGESQWELFLRGGRAIQSLIDRPPARYLVIGHGGLFNMALHAALGITPQANFQGARFRFQNSAFASLVYDPSQHNWYVHGINDRAHWQEKECYP
jgi:2,3-bisphosphoglycerate-dependent phosphoglycerate mutase